MGAKIEYTKGQKVGELIYLHETSRVSKTIRRAVFKCRQPGCDNEFITTIHKAKSMHTRSCGCLHAKSLKTQLTTHGLTGHHLGKAWHSMKQRCYNKKSKVYKYYGGRGITVCDEWLHDLKAFYDYVTQLPDYGKAGYTLDRENNDGNYEPGNVRWATMHIQSINKRKRENKSGYTGVSRVKNRYRSSISVYKKTTHIGYYDTDKLAVEARNNYIINNNLTEYAIQ